jgi:hypothetical protein
VPVRTDNSSTAVVVLGGHHRCEHTADEKVANDDGGCDEINSVAMFLDSLMPPLFVFTEL